MQFLLIFSFLIICLANDYELLDQLQSLDIGKTIIATMQISLESQDFTIDNVVNQLKNMQSNTQDELTENSQFIKNNEQSCNERFSELQTVIDSNQNYKSDAMRLLPFKQEEASNQLNLYKDQQTQYQRLKDRLNKLEFQRSDERNQYQTKQVQSIEFLQLLKKIKATLSQLNSQFLQVGDVKSKLDSQIKQLNVNHPFYQFIQILLVSAETNNATKVIQIINEIIESLSKLQSSDIKADNQKEELYLQQKQRYEKEINMLQNNFSNMEAQNEKLKQKVLELQNDIDNKDNIIQIKNQELKDWKQTCQDDFLSYKNIKELKSNELNIITECIEILTQRFNEGIKNYIENLEIKI